MSRHTIATVALAAAAVVAIAALAPWQVSADQPRGIKLEGGWVAKVQDEPGEWIWTFSPDASGRRASSHGGIIVHPMETPPSALEHHTPVIGEWAMTGPNTAAFNGLFYSTGGGHEIVDIGTVRGTTTFLSRGTAEGTYTFDFYPASADSDGDGIPEGAPYTTFTVSTRETQVPYPQ